MKKLNLFFLFIIFSSLTAFSQNPLVVNGVATYHSNINIGPKLQVPNTWNKIIIKKNVTITGSFYMPTRTSPIEILGEDRKTSIIQGDGSRPTNDGINGRSYSAIRADKSPDIYVHDLTITKPMKFHIHGGFGNVTVERCDIVAGSYTHTTDGIHGGVGRTVVKDCYINVYDDALYTIECKLIENTTIVHNKNGGPFMTSWGNDVPNGNVCVIRNCTVIAGHTGTDYNHGVVSWAGKSSGSVKETNTLKFEGTFEYIVPTGKKASTFYTIGRPNDPGLNNAHIVVDGQCPYKNSIDLRESTNSSVTFKNCETAPVSYSLTVNSGTGSGNVTAESTKTIIANAAPIGKVFDKWVVNSGSPSIANTNAASTILTMPAGNVTVTATYKDIIIDLTPTDITNLSATTILCNSVKLTWDDVQEEEAYRIRRKTATTNFVVLADVPANTTSYIDETAEENTTYQYMVRPMKGGVAVAVSNTPELSTALCKPSDIIDLAATSPSCTSVNLNWSDVSREDGYRVRRKTGTTAFVLLSDVPANTTNYVDATAEENTTYQYMVSPLQGSIIAATSNISEISTALCKPSDIIDLTATSTSCISVSLSWSNVSSEEGYRVRRKTATTNYIILADVPANTTSYVDTTVEENTTYQYMVRPLQGGLAVAVSNTPQILTEACITDPIPVDTYLKAYPNPTTGLLTLPEVFANDQIKVVSQQSGLTVLSRAIQQNGSTQLDITSQPAGSYIIQLVRNNQLLSRLIIKL